MCLFPIKNTNYNSPAYLSGVKEFECGSCPECLAKRSSLIALRDCYESRDHAFNCMITLTYDQFKYDDRGEIDGELPVNPDLKVNKRHIQLFIKRLRKWWSTISDQPIKYRCTAEYGSHTHRAHYHCILFGVKFHDAHYYKRSKRGYPIYMSRTLTKLWTHGICTIDSINIHTGVARYCSKYAAKDRSPDTFMLCSRGIGIDALLRSFNGINYMIDGHEYPIPRLVWERYIMLKYAPANYAISPKYVNRTTESIFDGSYDLACVKREAYRMIRDNDPVYQAYIQYWRSKAELREISRPSARDRLLHLDDSKYHAYRTKALETIDFNREVHYYPAPGSRACLSHYLQSVDRSLKSLGLRSSLIHYIPRDLLPAIQDEYERHLPSPSRPLTASDTMPPPLPAHVRDIFPEISLISKKSLDSLPFI